MPYVQFIVKRIKRTSTGRGIARISSDPLFFMLQKYWSWNPCSKRQSIAPSVTILYLHILYISDILKKIKSKILMRCIDFMAQVNYCKRGQGHVSLTLQSSRNNSSGKTYSYDEQFWETVYPKTLVNFGVLPLWKHVVLRRAKIISRIAQKNTYLIPASTDIQE
jgi:hypothetical protein